MARKGDAARPQPRPQGPLGAAGCSGTSRSNSGVLGVVGSFEAIAASIAGLETNANYTERLTLEKIPRHLFLPAGVYSFLLCCEPREIATMASRLVLVIGDLHIPDRAIDIPAKVLLRISSCIYKR